MTEKTIDILTPDGFRLKAILCMPNNIKKLVVMCHGISSHKQEYLDMFPRLAVMLAKERIGSIRFDFRGHGESSGSNIDFSVVSQLIDIEAVITWIRQQGECKGIPISYVGASFGGGCGVLYQKIHKAFDKISLFAPVLSYRRTFVEPQTEWGRANFNKLAWKKAKADGFLLLDGEFKVGLRLLTELLILDPLGALSEIGHSVQVFHGSEDSLVPYEVAEQIAVEIPGIDVRLIRGMGHGLYLVGDDDGVTEESKKIQEDYFHTTVGFLS